MLEVLSGKGEPDDFQIWTADVLRWRLDLIPRIAELLAGLPQLTSQIVHGDLAGPNVYAKDRRRALATVVGIFDELESSLAEALG